MATAASSITVPLYKILIEGAEIDPIEADAVHEIKITDWLRLPDSCSLAIGYQASLQGNPFQRLDDSKFKVGAQLEVKLGSTDERVTQTIFKGEIVTVEPDFQAGGVAMVVRAYDKTHRLMRERKQRAFLNQTVGDIVQTVAREHGLSADVEATGGPLEFVLQHNETDWDFVWRLARRVGFEVTSDGTRLSFKPPATGSPDVELAYPDDLISFRPRVTAVQQVKKVNVRGFDFKGKQAVTRTKGSAQQVTEAGIRRADVLKPFPDTELQIAGQSFTTTEEADNIAQAALDQLANAYLAAEGSTFGNPAIKAGALIRITGVGNDFSGTYRVAKAVHVLQTGGYQTQFANSAGEHTLLGQLGGSNGSAAAARNDSIVVGIVTNNKDPETLGRIKVQLPFLSEQETFWAPVVVPSAGKDRGLSMLPVPGEQVVVAFENGDPSYPVVLGSVFNGKDTPDGTELAATDGSFGLKSDHKAVVHAKEDIELHTDKGKWLVKVDGGEIVETVKSPGNYTGSFDGKYDLTSTQAMTLKSSQSITIESQMGITIKAPQITVEAQGQLSMKSNGMLSIEGATVQVNGKAAVNIGGGLINLG